MNLLLVVGLMSWSPLPTHLDTNPDSLTVDYVVERYVAAIGGLESIKAINNLVYSEGNYVEGDDEYGGATMSLGRPFFKLVGDKNDPGGYMEGYDGAAWEWFGDPGVVIRTVGPASEAIRHYAGVENPLVDYRAKGSTVVLKGRTVMLDRPVVVLESTRRDGFVEQFYLDTDSWLVVASGGSAPIHAFGDEVFSVTWISDYRPVAGVMIAHNFRSVRMPEGIDLSSMQWGRIEANRDLPNDWFSPPDFVRTPTQHLIESLYQQRSDTQAVMWTYREFRLAYPGVDVSEALNVAGYQTLKMGDVEAAISLLHTNVIDYPESANARFGLGRALRTDGRIQEAKVEFEAALGIDPGHKRSRNALMEIEETAEH